MQICFLNHILFSNILQNIWYSSYFVWFQISISECKLFEACEIEVTALPQHFGYYFHFSYLCFSVLWHLHFYHMQCAISKSLLHKFFNVLLLFILLLALCFSCKNNEYLLYGQFSPIVCQDIMTDQEHSISHWSLNL